MWAYLNRLFDLLLPRKERTVRVEEYRTEHVPVITQEHAAFGMRITTLLEYRDKVVEDIIWALKYDGSAYAAELLATLLAEYLREEIVEKMAFSNHPILLVPVPLHPIRQKERGFNQIEMVLNALPPEFHNGKLSRIVHVLERVRSTKQQARLTRDERYHNVSGVFMLTFPELVRDAHIILIDDVTTTGATLTEASRPLTSIVTSVTLLALARA